MKTREVSVNSNFNFQPILQRDHVERVYSVSSDDLKKKFDDMNIQEQALIIAEDKELKDSKQKFKKNYDKMTAASCISSFIAYCAYRMTIITIKTIPGARIEKIQFFGKIFIQALAISAVVYGIFRLSFFEDDKQVIEILMKRDQRNRDKFSQIEKTICDIDRRPLGMGELSMSPNSRLKHSTLLVNSQITDHHTQTNGNQKNPNLLSDEVDS